jgi:hypothetical protein
MGSAAQVFGQPFLSVIEPIHQALLLVCSEFYEDIL